MIQAQPRFDAGGQQFVDQPVVEGEARFICGSSPLRQHARPGNREPIGLNAQPFHQGDILPVTMVVVARDIAGVVVLYFAVLTVDVPDTRSSAVFFRCALDLETRGGDTPDEIRTQAGDRKAAPMPA